MTPVKFIHVDLEPNQIKKQLEPGGPEVYAAFIEALIKIHSFSNMAQLAQDPGLNWEKLKGGKVFPGTKLPVYTFRITLKWRALCTLQTGPVIQVRAVTTEHDGTH